MGVEIRFDDGTWSYALGPSIGRVGQELSAREARRVLERWLAREPWRSQLRGYAALEVRAEARADDVLIERVCALLQARGVGLWRTERMEQWDAAAVVEAAEAEAEPLVAAREEDDTHWIQVVVVDEEERPLAGVRYRIGLTDGRVREGRTDANGRIYINKIPAGECSFSVLEHEGTWNVAG